MELNGAALEGLEILENALGGTQGSLLGLLDHCCTPFGRRRLRRWLTRPLFRKRDIERRQDAVEVRGTVVADDCSFIDDVTGLQSLQQQQQQQRCANLM
jgi:DNA mismatch repair ATPase MutS